MLDCVDITLRGRCAENVYPSRVAEGESPRCYYHDKIYRGLCDNSSAVVVEDVD